MQILLILGTEGGIGKTSTVFILASRLLRDGNVVVIDANTINNDSWKIYDLNDVDADNYQLNDLTLRFKKRHASSFYFTEFKKWLMGAPLFLDHDQVTTLKCTDVQLLFELRNIYECISNLDGHIADNSTPLNNQLKWEFQNLKRLPGEDYMGRVNRFEQNYKEKLNKKKEKIKSCFDHPDYWIENLDRIMLHIDDDSVFSHSITTFRVNTVNKLFDNDTAKWFCNLIRDADFENLFKPKYVLIDTNYSPGNFQTQFFADNFNHYKVFAFTILGPCIFAQNSYDEHKNSIIRGLTNAFPNINRKIFIFSTFENYNALHFFKKKLVIIFQELYNKVYDTIMKPGSTVEEILTLINDRIRSNTSLPNDDYGLFNVFGFSKYVRRFIYNRKASKRGILKEFYKYFTIILNHQQYWSNRTSSGNDISPRELSELFANIDPPDYYFLDIPIGSLNFTIMRQENFENLSKNPNIYIENYLQIFHQKITINAGNVENSVGDLFSEFKIDEQNKKYLEDFIQYLEGVLELKKLEGE